jgi:hypothetical protein
LPGILNDQLIRFGSELGAACVGVGAHPCGRRGKGPDALSFRRERLASECSIRVEGLLDVGKRRSRIVELLHFSSISSIMML